MKISDNLKNELRIIEDQFLKGIRRPKRKWKGYNFLSKKECVDKVSLQRGILNTFCKTVKLGNDFSNFKCLEIGVEKHQNLKIIFGISNLERMDRINLISGINVDHVMDLVEDSIDHLKNQYDFVICSNTLEHTFDIHEAIKRLFELVKPGGLIYISMPFLHGLHLEPYDYWRITPYALEKILSKYTKNFIVLKEGCKPMFKYLVYKKFRLGGYCLHGVSAFATKEY